MSKENRGRITRRDFLRLFGLSLVTAVGVSPEDVEAKMFRFDVEKGRSNKSHIKEVVKVENLNEREFEENTEGPRVDVRVVQKDDFATQFPEEIFDPINPKAHNIYGCNRFSGDAEQCLEIDPNKRDDLRMWFKSPYYGYYHDSANSKLNPRFLVAAQVLDSGLIGVSVAGVRRKLAADQCAVFDVSYQEYWEGSFFDTEMRFTLCSNPEEGGGGILLDSHRLK
jgi:hypothetical protein